jgi:hypothetical protein
LTEEDLTAGGYKPIKSWVPAGEALGAKNSKQRADQRAKLAEDKKVAQYNFTATTDPDKRATIKALADAVVEDSTHAALAALLANPTLLKLVVKLANSQPETRAAAEEAIASPEIVVRGRNTSEPPVRAAVDAILGLEGLRNLVMRLAADNGRDKAGQHRPATDWIAIANIVFGDPACRKCVRAMSADHSLAALMLAIVGQPELRRACQAIQKNLEAVPLIIRLLTCATEVLANVSVAVDRPKILRLAVQAARSKALLDAVATVVAEPHVVTAGKAVLATKSWRRWLVTRLSGIA